jgi:hypothetical protein
MNFPVRFVAATLIAWAAFGACFAAACGGKTQSMITGDAGSQETIDGATTGIVTGTTIDGARSGIVTVTTSAGDGSLTGAQKSEAAEDSADEPIDTCRYLDARVPSAAPQDQCAWRLFSCADGCNVAPADVACDAASDCTLLIRPASCGSCSRIAIGVNGTRTIPRCPADLCAPAFNGPCVLWTETCDIIDDASVAGVECIDHQCVSYYTTGSE